MINLYKYGRPDRSRSSAIFCLCLFVLLPAIATEPSLNDRGRLQYEDDCAGCHGISGHGDGAVASVLTIKPTDLTVLAKDNKGHFPQDYVRRVIDGRELPAYAHGQVAMPVWGRHYQRSGLLAYSEERVQQRIDALIAYLQSIQSD